MNKLKDSKAFSLLIIASIYIFTFILLLPLNKLLGINNLYLNILVLDVIATSIIFIFSCVFKNSSIYDPYWSIAPLVILLYLTSKSKVLAFNVIGLGLLVVIWSLRLTLNWALSFKNIQVQDWRYEMLEKKCGKWYFLVNYFGIHLFPTLVVYLLIIPLITFYKANVFNKLSYIGIAIMLVAIIIETLADLSLHLNHQSVKYSREKIIKDGLWKYSRHPNYFGEILFWYGLAFASFCLSSNYLLFVGPIVNNLMFIFISIPLQEKRLASYKIGYEDYKKEVRMLIPIRK